MQVVGEAELPWKPIAVQRESGKEAKVLLSSGYCIGEEAEAMVEAGAAGFLQKPFKLAELIRRIADIH